MRVARARTVAALIAVCCVGALCDGLQAAPNPAEPAPAVMQPASMAFDIAPQDLKHALDEYQVATGLSVLYETRLVEGRRSAPVHGQFSARQALGMMLAGTGLAARFVNDRSAMLARAAVSAAPSAAVPEQHAHHPYDAQTRSRLAEALCAHSAVQPGRHRMVLRYWLDGEGRIEQVRVRIAAAPWLESQVRTALTGLHMGRPPPGMPGSAVVLIRPSVSHRETCAVQAANRVDAAPPPEARHE